MKKFIRYLYIFLISAGLVGIDIVTKIIFQGKTIVIIKDFFVIQSVPLNTGAGLGVLSGHTTLLIVMSLVFIIAFFVFDFFYKNNNKLYIASFCLIIGGAFGNLIDRFFLGGVRDFLHINLPFMQYYFNVADAFLTIGVILLIIEILFKNRRKKREKEQNGKIKSK